MRYSRELTSIHRYLSGEMDEIEAEEFNIWVGADDRNQKLFSEVSAIWTASSILPTKKFDANKAFLKHKSLLDKEVGVLNGVKELFIWCLDIYSINVVGTKKPKWCIW